VMSMSALTMSSRKLPVFFDIQRSVMLVYVFEWQERSDLKKKIFFQLT
jgi:hypothetical protein